MRILGSIKCLESIIENSKPGQTQAPTQVILFHGFGADAYDLQSLSEVLEVKGDSHWLFPQGVMEVPIGPGWTGRAWWPINMLEIQEMAARGIERDISDHVPAELAKLRERVFEMISALKVPWNQIVLGGFSQGAMLATDIALSAPETPKGLVLFSGALINRTDWAQKAPHRKGLRFFQSHGRHDQVLSYKGAQRLEGLLTGAGLKGSLLGFEGAHEIPPMVIQKANEYLRGL